MVARTSDCGRIDLIAVTIRVLIGGDIYPGRLSIDRLIAGDLEPVFHGLLPVLAAADYVLANLEGPLIAMPSPMEKIGPHHGFADACLGGLVSAGIDALNLGNNHSMDHGEVGLAHTLRRCEQQHMATVGAGASLEAAGRPLVREVEGVRLGVLSYTEFEFGMAGRECAGTHPINPVHFVRTVQRHRQEWDRLIVLMHAGNEYYPYPRPSLRDLARFMCEQGAAAVIFQHSHCAGCWEEHAGGFIVHGQGNLLFDTHRAHPCEMEGFLVELAMDKSSAVRMEVVPYAQAASGLGPELMTGERKDSFLRGLAERSTEIQRPGFVEAQWESFTRETPYNYLSLIQGHGKRVRELDRKFGFLRHFYSRERLRMLLHLIRCESHREAIITLLTNALKR